MNASQLLQRTTHSPLSVQDRAGRSQGYNCIIETFQCQAYNLAWHMIGDWALAEAAVKDRLASGNRAFIQFRGANLKAWTKL